MRPLVDRGFIAAFALITVLYIVHILNVLVESGVVSEGASTGLALPLSLFTTLTLVWVFERIIRQTTAWSRFAARLDEVRA